MKEVAEELERMHLITNKSLFVLWSKLRARANNRTGEYVSECQHGAHQDS